ncbi:hypothetical protein BDR03DRAFT_943989 [Suillus americanus]|nr:hypothetical protein BDR03DRAFT_943989 [Suillus americanus]
MAWQTKWRSIEWPCGTVSLTINLYTGFQQRSVPSDLDEAIELQHVALLLTPPSHFDRVMYLNNLALSLQDSEASRLISMRLSSSNGLWYYSSVPRSSSSIRISQQSCPQLSR